MLRKSLSLLILAAALSTASYAQSARKVLDTTAARLTKQGGVMAKFKATQFDGTTPQSESSGSIQMDGKRFFIATDEILTWFDGKTQWSMMTGSHEVNITEPDEDDLVEINPAILVNIYKRGFNYSMSKSTLRGRATFVVHLWPRYKGSDYSDIFIDIDQATYNPLCIRAKRDGNWIRLAILSFQNGFVLPPATFTFPKQDYPNVEVIDLR